MMTTFSSSDKVAVSKWAQINEDRKGVKPRVFRVLRTKIHVKFMTVISRNCATENAYNTTLISYTYVYKQSKHSCIFWY